MRRRAERIDKDQTRVAATDAVRCGGPSDYEKASKQHATDGKDIRRATDTDLFASQRKLGEDPAGFAERGALARGDLGFTPAPVTTAEIN